MDKSKKEKRVFAYILLHVIFLLYSVSGICSKIAAGEVFFSFKFFVFFAMAIAVMGVYAILWQKILKVLPLTNAYASKAVTIIWAMVWGYFIFHENITLPKIIGGVLVVAGVVLYSLSDRKDENAKE